MNDRVFLCLVLCGSFRYYTIPAAAPFISTSGCLSDEAPRADFGASTGAGGADAASLGARRTSCKSSAPAAMNVEIWT